MADFSISYSFGGSKAEPLIRRTVAMVVEGTITNLQEVLLERTDLLLADLCLVFDEAMAALVESEYTDDVQVNILMGACAYCVNNILAQSPSAKYAFMFTRVQKLLNTRSELVRTMGPAAVKTLTEFILPVWDTLKSIDSIFANDVSSCHDRKCGPSL